MSYDLYAHKIKEQDINQHSNANVQQETRERKEVDELKKINMI